MVKNVVKNLMMLGFQPLISPCQGESREFALGIRLASLAAITYSAPQIDRDVLNVVQDTRQEHPLILSSSDTVFH